VELTIHDSRRRRVLIAQGRSRAGCDGVLGTYTVSSGAVLERPLGQVLGDVEVSDEQVSLGDQSVTLGTQARVVIDKNKRPTLRAQVACGVVAAPLFITAFTAIGAKRPG
jgi:hypothetical protein